MSVEVRFAPDRSWRTATTTDWPSIRVGDWCPFLYPAEARREVAPELVADSEATDNPFGRDNHRYGGYMCWPCRCLKRAWLASMLDSAVQLFAMADLP
jgi:hypothetical protein